MNRLIRQIGYNYSRLYSTSVRTNVISSLSKKCQCCGSAFHESGDKQQPGHKILKQVKLTDSVKANKNQTIDGIFRNLDQDKLNFLQNEIAGDRKDEIDWTTNTYESIEKSRHDKKLKQKRNDYEKLCTRCFDIKSNAKPEIIQPAESPEKFLEAIPESAKIVHVINAVDYPASVLKTMSSKKNVIWVINKADQIVKDEKTSFKRVLPYLQQELKWRVNAPMNKVFLVSAEKKWGLDHLFTNLGPENYLIGDTNSGKTKLALELARMFGKGPIPNFPQRLLGANSFPWTTQQPFEYELGQDKMLVDMPSIPQVNNGVYAHLRPKLYKNLSEGRVLFKEPGMYNVERVVAPKPTQVVSFGGILAIEHDRLHLIAWGIAAFSQDTMKVLNSVEKVEEMVNDPKIENAHWFYAIPGNSKLTKVKEFDLTEAGLTIAIRGLGIVHMHAAGKFGSEPVKIKVYMLPNVQVVERPNILPYLRSNDDPRYRAESKKMDSMRDYKKKKSSEKRSSRNKFR